MIDLIIPTLDHNRGYETAALAIQDAGIPTTVRVVVDEERTGYTRTVNRGLQQARQAGHDACILVDDCRPRTDDWLLIMWLNLQRRDSVWFAGPSGPCRTSPQCTGTIGDLRKPRLVSHVAGFCVLAKSHVLGEVGLLNEEFIHYGSDVDWQWRARGLGGRTLWVPGVYVDHEVHDVNKWALEDNRTFHRIWD